MQEIQLTFYEVIPMFILIYESECCAKKRKDVRLIEISNEISVVIKLCTRRNRPSCEGIREEQNINYWQRS